MTETIPSLSIMPTARLSMVPLSLYTITDQDSDWTESTITWNNAPKNTSTPPNGFQPSGTVLLATTVVDSTTAVNGDEISFTEAALTEYLNWAAGQPQELLSPDFELIPAKEEPGYVLFRAKENTDFEKMFFKLHAKLR